MGLEFKIDALKYVIYSLNYVQLKKCAYSMVIEELRSINHLNATRLPAHPVTTFQPKELSPLSMHVKL